jgi:hypothetical protein
MILKGKCFSVGIVLIQLSPSQIAKVTNVMHVPTLKKNLFSVSKSTNKGHSNMEFIGNYCVVKLTDQNGKFNLFSIANKKTIFMVLLWHEPMHLMLHLVFLPLPKHQHCKVSYGIIARGIYIYMPSNKCKILNW